MHKYHVVKRDGNQERISFDKISKRIELMCDKLALENIDIIDISKETISGLYDGITTEELDIFSSKVAANKILEDPEYSKLAGGICISNLHKSTSSSFLSVTEQLWNNVDEIGNKFPLISEEYYEIVKNNWKEFDVMIDYERDYYQDYFGFKTLERSYLIRKQPENKILERPQHLWMRVSVGLHKNDLEKVKETYDNLSLQNFTHATPTLFNSGTNIPQLASCYLFNPSKDDLDDMYDTVRKAANTSKYSGGIGMGLTNLRSKDSLIRSTNGKSNGIIPFIQVIDNMAKHVNQGGRRPGSVAAYLEPWHSDVQDFLEIRTNTGEEGRKAKDMFSALWIPDIFMQRVSNDEKWSLMDPNECPGLVNAYGKEFTELYEKYEKEGRMKKVMNARTLFQQIMSTQIETGMPYMLYKCSINRKNNQSNLGTIMNSNLCAEIVEYSDSDNTAVCNLASICLPKCVFTDEEGKTYFDYDKLQEIVRMIVRNLDKTIDINFYPTECEKKTNSENRPIGMGVQGLADVYFKFRVPFKSKEARDLNKRIFETMYYAAAKESMELSKKYGPYSSFRGSPISEGKFHYELWGLTDSDLLMGFDWQKLRENIMEHGIRNSLLIACMPTQSTSQIMGNTECFEPITSNLYVRKTNAGEFIVSNKYLVSELKKIGLWNENIITKLKMHNGSVQNIREIPEDIRNIYMTAYEIGYKAILIQAKERGPFVDQSQSMNLFSSEPNFNKLFNAHIWGWKNGLKTGMYYLKSKPAANPLMFGIDKDIQNKIAGATSMSCSIDGECLMCGS